MKKTMKKTNQNAQSSQPEKNQLNLQENQLELQENQLELQENQLELQATKQDQDWIKQVQELQASTNRQITPDWIVGMTDGDGHFRGRIDKNGWKICDFIISQNKRSVHVLDQVCDYFKCGSVHKAGGDMMEFAVSNKKDLKTTVIPFFNNHHLQTLKFYDFLNMRSLVCPETTNNEPIKPTLAVNWDWLAGFTDAEGCFYMGLCLDKRALAKGITKYIFLPKFFLGAKEKEIFHISIPILNGEYEILDKVKNFVGFGHVRKRKNEDFYVYEISALSDLLTVCNNLVTRLRTTKLLSLEYFLEILKIMEKKEHMTEQGLERIRELKSKMNKF